MPAKKRAYCTEDGDSGVEVYYREEEEKEKKHKKSKVKGCEKGIGLSAWWKPYFSTEWDG